MATAYLVPDGNGSPLTWDDGTGTPGTDDYQQINSGINGGSPTDGSYIQQLKNNNTSSRFVFENTPGNFSSLNTLTVRVRNQYNPSWVDDADRFEITVYDNADTQIGATKTRTPTTSWVTTVLTDTNWDAMSQAQIDGMKVEVTYIQSNTGMPDSGVGIQVSEIEVELDYNAATPSTDLTQLTHRTGHRPGPGHGLTRHLFDLGDVPQPIPFRLIPLRTGHEPGPLARNDTRIAREDIDPPQPVPFDLVAKRTGHQPGPDAPNDTRSNFHVVDPPQPVPFDLRAKTTGHSPAPGQRNVTRITRPDVAAPPAGVDLTQLTHRTGHDLRAPLPPRSRFIRPDEIPFDPVNLGLITHVTGHTPKPGQKNETRFTGPLEVPDVTPFPFDLVAKKTGHQPGPDKRNVTRMVLVEFLPVVAPTPFDLVAPRTGIDAAVGKRNITRFTRPDVGAAPPLDPTLLGLITHVTGADARVHREVFTRQPEGFVHPDTIGLDPALLGLITHVTGMDRHIHREVWTRPGLPPPPYTVPSQPTPNLPTKVGPSTGEPVPSAAGLPPKVSTVAAPTRTGSTGGRTKVDD